MSDQALPEADKTTSRRQLFRWLGWFALANAAVFAIISLQYLSGSSPGQTALAWIYIITVYIGHHVLLSVLPLFLLIGPLILLWPKRPLVTGCAISLIALMIAITLLDSLLWSQSRFHLNALTMQILGYQSWVFVGVILLISLVFESFLAKNLWPWVQAKPRRKGWLAGWICTLSILVSQGIHAWADASYYVPVTSIAQQLPVYSGVTAKSLLTKNGIVDAAASRERELAKRLAREVEGKYRSPLSYPLEPLQCTDLPDMNLLIILVDSMRSDMFSPDITPNISRQAAERGAAFSQHFSGGNSSKMGAFSFFYGLPPGYWNSFEALQQPPVLIRQLQREGYQLGIFSSQTMYRPVMLDRTAFAEVPNLRMSSKPLSDPAWKRDQTVLREWKQWLDARDPGQPFFGFLFFDSALAKSFPDDQAMTFEAENQDPYQQELARYKTAIHFVDGLVGEVLQGLEDKGLTENTVVVFSSDHGEEFDDSGAGLDEHGSGYTHYQLQTPMVLLWPGRTGGEVYSHRTSHYDVAPTLVSDFLGCSNPPADYSVGKNLFRQESWDWMIAGSYFNYAVLEPHQVTITFPNGGVEVRDWDYRLLDRPKFDGDILNAVSEQNTRFHAQ